VQVGAQDLYSAFGVQRIFFHYRGGMSVGENSPVQVEAAVWAESAAKSAETCETQVQVADNKRLAGGGRWIRTLSPVSSCWVRSYLSATYGDFIPGPSAAEKRIRLGYAIE